MRASSAASMGCCLHTEEVARQEESGRAQDKCWMSAIGDCPDRGNRRKHHRDDVLAKTHAGHRPSLGERRERCLESLITG
ncbi:hypothetical protein GCM10009861_09680 [Neomicrococcus aestuarii]